MEELNTSVETLEVAEPELQSEETQEVAEPVVDNGRTEMDSAFAEMRRRNAEYERQVQELTRERDEALENARLYDETMGLFFEGDNKIAQARAYHDNTTVEEVMRGMEEEKARKTLAEERQSFEREKAQFNYQRLKMQDLNELKAIGAELNDVEELGEDFFAYRTAGLSARQAYEVIQAKKSTPPKTMGTVKAEAPEREYFTRDEVELMTSEQRIKNYDKIRASMSKW